MSAFLIGALFSFGLVVSGMTQPAKVISFLNITGAWDPTLIFVLASAVIVNFIGYRIVLARSKPELDSEFHLPEKGQITPALLAGSFIFGIGWGLGGYCPGPALVSLLSFQLAPFAFVAAMLVGIFLFRRLNKKFPIER